MSHLADFTEDDAHHLTWNQIKDVCSLHWQAHQMRQQALGDKAHIWMKLRFFFLTGKVIWRDMLTI
jgi:hypothetical protein